MVKVLHQLQCYTASLDWSEFGEVKKLIQAYAADKDPDEGITVFNKVLAKFDGHYPAGLFLPYQTLKSSKNIITRLSPFSTTFLSQSVAIFLFFGTSWPWR